MTEGNGTPSPGGPSGLPEGAGGSSTSRSRWRGWAGRHGPETLIGALVVTVVGAVASVILTSVFEGGDDEEAKGPPPAASGSPGTATPGSAASPSCAAETCVGLDPRTTGCDVGARTLEKDWVGTMQLEIRYSERCATVWGKLTGARPGDTVTINTTPSQRQAASVREGQTNYTPMLAVEDDFSAQATATAVSGKPDEEIPRGYTLRVGADRTSLPSASANAQPV
ncbi:DUF2690 domain-containing protein [Streptomyces sp. NPDC057545]|uniref:DUF2690 domain-containing protein n=1 Tax=Streptomyces sp. NPDC057545 TaxID=3346164 RepID=UPI00368AF3D4